MLVTMVTTVSFEMPKDYDALMEFRTHENMESWEEHTAGPYITFTTKPRKAWVDKFIYGGVSDGLRGL